MSKAHWVALAATGRVGGKTFTRLLSHLGSLEAIFEATPEQLIAIPSIGPKTAAAIAAIDLAAAQADLDRIEAQGIRVITWEDTAYPAKLLLIEDAPPVLFVRGSLPPPDTRTVAIVGTRRPTEDGVRLAHEVAYQLARRGWTVVSGLALGIDTAAHRGALAAGDRTLAVLGCGLARIYPTQNIHLADDIADHGALLSELHPDTTVSSQGLVARNRIISGLSQAVIVIQASNDSGSLHTARRAQEQGRVVFAAANGDSGCADLIARGAQPLSPQEKDWDGLSDRIARLTLSSRRRLT